MTAQIKKGNYDSSDKQKGNIRSLPPRNLRKRDPFFDLPVAQQILKVMKDENDEIPRIIEEAGIMNKIIEANKKNPVERIRQICDALNIALKCCACAGWNFLNNEILDPETLEIFFTHEPYKTLGMAFGLADIAGYKTNNENELIETENKNGSDLSPASNFLQAVLKYIDRQVAWRGLLHGIPGNENEILSKGLLAWDENEVLGFYMDGKLEEYIRIQDETVAVYEEAMLKYGLKYYIRLIGGGYPLELKNTTDHGFCTTPDGAVYLPNSIGIFGTREENLTNYLISTTHEGGHWRWESFRINSRILDWSLLGAKFIKSIKVEGNRTAYVVEGEVYEKENRKGQLVSVKKSQKEEIVIRNYVDIMRLVKYPKFIKWLHNIVDDRRVDILNMVNNPGLAGKYKTDNLNVLRIRPDVKDPTLGHLLEAILQITIIGKIKGEVPEELKPLLEKAGEIVSEMEIRENTDGTESLNVALKLYNMLIPYLEDIAERVELLDEEIEKSLPKDRARGETDISQHSPELTTQDGGKIILKKPTKRDRGKKDLGVNPLDFLDFDMKTEGNGEGGEGGDKGGTPSGSGGLSNPMKNDTTGKPGNGNKDEGKDGNKDGEGGGEKKPGEKLRKASKRAQGGKEGPRTYKYNEFNGKTYHRKTATVIEHPFKDGKSVIAPQYLVGQVKTMFKRFAPKEGILIRGTESGEEDPDLVETWMQKFDAGIIEPQEFYCDVLDEKRSTLTGMIIDGSPSMGMDASAGLSRFEVAMQSVATIYEASYLLRDPMIAAIFGGSVPTDYYLMDLQATKKNRHIMIPEGMNSHGTPLAASIRHQTAMLKRLNKIYRKRRIQSFIVTDGEPNCTTVALKGQSNVEVSVINSAKAVQEARALGQRVYGVIVTDEHNKSQLENQYATIFGGFGNFVVISNASKMPRLLLEFYKRGAKAQGESKAFHYA